MIRFHPDALAEIERGRDWYDAQRVGLGSDLVAAVERALDAIDEAPHSFPRTRETRLARRAAVPPFPYWIVFSIQASDNHILIVALTHMRRRPGHWRTRTRERS